MDKGEHLFSNKVLWKLLLPIMAEQLLNSFMGMADSMMVSSVGPEALSAVALVDSVNVLVLQALAALATGGVIICSNYLGQQKPKEAQEAAKQLMLVAAGIALVLTGFGLAFRMPLLRLIFGQVEPAVMEASGVYFLITLLSYPGVSLSSAGGAIFRAQEDSRTPMLASLFCNILNIGCNALFIYLFGWGVAGAAVATTLSRIVNAAALLLLLRNEKLLLHIRNYASIRPAKHAIRMILRMGIPNGIENSSFQFGKLMIQSTVSAMGTMAIAAQAMANIFESLNGVAGVGVGIGLMTVVGHCLGAGRKDEAYYYVKKLTFWSIGVVTVSCLVTYGIAFPLTGLMGMSQESKDLFLYMLDWITIVKPLTWSFSFTPAYGLRAAGDVRFSMIVSMLTMWLCRVALCIFCARVLGMGPMAVWIGMFADWTIRGVIFIWRTRSKRWLRHRVTV